MKRELLDPGRSVAAKSPEAATARASAVAFGGEKRSGIVPAGAPETSLAEAFVEVLVQLGVQHAFGVLGGAIAVFAEAIHESSIELLHFRHEGGAAFAAIEASLALRRPVVVFSTTGPGLTNLLTGMLAARAEGAWVIYVSGVTNASHRHRAAFQESGPHADGCGFLYQSGAIAHHAQVLEDPAELSALAAKIQLGLARPNGFVAHVGLPLAVQTARSAVSVPPSLTVPAGAALDEPAVAQCLELLVREPFVIWAGFGARGAAPLVRQLAEASGAKVMCSPRAKGVLPEDHPLFLGVTGLGGHESVREHLRAERPSRILVLGSRLGEFTSFWSSEYLPRDGLIHVDVDSSAFGVGFPQAQTLCIHLEIGAFLSALLARWPSACAAGSSYLPLPQRGQEVPRSGRVRPSFLFSEVQRCIVEGSDAIVMTEAGNAFLLGSRHLAFRSPGRYRVSTSFGSMGQAAAGVLGAALGPRKAVAIVGDGAMLMHNELSTACQYSVGAVWIVLNDSRYGMIAQGMQAVGMQPFETELPRVDFAMVAEGMGVAGVRVECEADVASGLQRALSARGPFLVDVWIDRDEPPVLNPRNQSLVVQGLNRRGAPVVRQAS